MGKLPKNQAALPAPPTAAATPFPLAAAGPARRKKTAPPTAPEPACAPAAPKTTPEERLCNRALSGLGKRAAGCVTLEVKTTYETDPDGLRRVKNEVVTRKQSPPDLDAIVFALTNIDGVRWNAKPGEAAQGLSALPDEVLRNLLPYFRKDEK